MKDADCTYAGSTGKYCSADKCVGCKADADCAGQAFTKCDTATGTCSKCGADTECKTAKIGDKCNSGTCNCSVDTDCTAPLTCK